MKTFRQAAFSIIYAIRKRFILILLIYVGLWIFGHAVQTFVGLPGLWGPVIKGRCPNGEVVTFQIRKPEARLLLKTPQGYIEEYRFPCLGDYPYVTIKASPDGKGVWVSPGGKVYIALDLLNGNSYGGDMPGLFPSWAKGLGTVVAKGRTWSIWQYLSPW
jgi:hypothetical protein